MDHLEKIKESRDERDQEYEGLAELLLSSRQPEHLLTRALDTEGEMAPKIICVRPFDCRAAEKDARTATRSLTHPRPKSYDWNRALCACAQSTASGDVHQGT